MHFTDITVREVVTVVKVVRRGELRTRVLLSNGRNELIPTPHISHPTFVEVPIHVEVGDTVVMLPSTDGWEDVDRDVVMQGLIRMKKAGTIPDFVIKSLGYRTQQILANVKPLE